MIDKEKSTQTAMLGLSNKLEFWEKHFENYGTPSLETVERNPVKKPKNCSHKLLRILKLLIKSSHNLKKLIET